MQVVNIRGNTSSGKTTLMRTIIAQEDRVKIITLTKEVKGTLLQDHNYIVIGTYKKGGKFGGCDSIAKVAYMEQAIWKALTIAPTVLFEGLLVSFSYQRWKDFSDKLQTLQIASGVDHRSCNGMIWAFVYPTFRQNLKQLKGRNGIKDLRKERGDKFVMNFIQRFKSITRLLKKAKADKQNIIYPSNDAYPFDHVIQFINVIGDQKLLKASKNKGIGKFLK